MYGLQVQLFKFVHESIDDPEVRILVTNPSDETVSGLTVTWTYHWGEIDNPPPLSLARFKGAFVEEFGEFGDGPLHPGESREFGLEQGSVPVLRNVLAATSPDQYRIVVRLNGEVVHVITGAEFGIWFDKNFPETG